MDREYLEILGDLELTRRSDKEQGDMEELARIKLREPGLSEYERAQIRQAVNRAYWNRQWGWAIRQVARYWR